MEQLLSLLFSGQALSQAQTRRLFEAIINGELAPEQLAGALIALKVRGETTAELCGAVEASLQASQPFERPDYPFADIVGTGGDGANTINISTASAITAAACGLKVAKHGNRSVSSKSGASDVLTALGVNVSMSAQTARQALDQTGICFLFAQQYHQGFKHAVGVRQALKTRTIFNILGPLINPARPKRQLLGVYSPDLLMPYAQAVQQLGHEHTIIVHGSGLDEVALHGQTEVIEVRDGKLERYTLSPTDFGLPITPLEALKGGEPAENARAIQALFAGNGATAHAHAVALNTALLMKLFSNENLKQNAELVLDTLAQGKPAEVLAQLQQIG